MIIIGHVWLWTSVLRGARPQEPACAHCGYAVSELTNLTCPECGNDLREVGITGRYRRGVPAWVFLLVWLVLLAFPARSTAPIIMGRAPLYVTTGYSIDLAPHSGVADTVTLAMRLTYRMQGRSGMPGLPGVNVAAHGTEDVPSATLGLPSFIQMYGTDNPVTSEVSATTTSGYVSPLDLGNPPYAAADIRAFLATLGSTASDEELTADAEELAALLNAWNTMPATFTTTRFGFTGGAGLGPIGPEPPAWLMPTILAAWIALYAIGVLLYFRLRRRRPAPTTAGPRHAAA